MSQKRVSELETLTTTEEPEAFPLGMMRKGGKIPQGI